MDGVLANGVLGVAAAVFKDACDIGIESCGHIQLKDWHDWYFYNSINVFKSAMTKCFP